MVTWLAHSPHVLTTCGPNFAGFLTLSELLLNRSSQYQTLNMKDYKLFYWISYTVISSNQYTQTLNHTPYLIHAFQTHTHTPWARTIICVNESISRVDPTVQFHLLHPEQTPGHTHTHTHQKLEHFPSSHTEASLLRTEYSLTKPYCLMAWKTVRL